MKNLTTAAVIRTLQSPRNARIDLEALRGVALPVAVLASDLRFDCVSPAFAALPASVPPAVGRHLSEVLPDFDPAAARAVLETGRPLRTADVPMGSSLWKFDLLPLTCDDDDPNAILILASAIPAVGTGSGPYAEATLDTPEQRRNEALSAAGIGEWGIDFESGTVQRSELLDRLFGLGDSGSAVPIPTFLQALHPEDRPSVEAEIERSRRQPCSIDAECRVVQPDGSHAWVALRGKTLPAVPGQPRRLAGVLMDMNGRKSEQHALARTLAETEAALERSRVQFGEVHHRVKNSLQLVASLLNLQGRTLATEPFQEQFAEAYRRVLTVAAVHDRLYRTEKISSIDFGGYLAALCHDAERLAAMGGRECVVSIDAIEAELPTDKAISLALITNELIVNALKHAYPGDQPCHIDVGFARLPDGGFRLTVADHGQGLPEDFVPAKRKTLGMRLITALTRQIDGQLEAEPQSPGTRFVLSFR